MAHCAQQIHTSMYLFSTKKSGQSGRWPTSVSFNTGSSFAIPLSTLFLKPKTSVDNKGFTVGPVRVVSEKVIAIDFGTTNSVAAVIRDGHSVPVIIPSTKRPWTTHTPSVVAYTQNGDCIVGQMAKQQAALNPDNTFSNVKYFIGKKRSEVDKELEKQVSYRVVTSDDNSNVRLDCPAIGKNCAVEEISAQVLRKLVNGASKFLKDEVSAAVITVPAHFNDCQKKAIRDAGHIAGLDKVYTILEPIAVSVAYVYKGMKPQILLVFDIGGATFDVTVLEVSESQVKVLATSGDLHLGGDDFDKRIADWLALSFKRYEGIELLEDKQARKRLTEIAEKVKMELSSSTEANLSLPFITATASGPKNIKTTLTRAKFEELCADLLDRLNPPVEKCLRDAKLSITDLDGVILAGGSTHIPAVQEHVKKLIGKEPNVTINPDEVVALGGAILAENWRPRVMNCIQFSEDKTPLSLGLETLGGVMMKVIPRNTTFPTYVSEVFSTATDGQTSVKINVLRGEGEFARDNESVGCFRLDGIPPAPCGIPQIEVRFYIDAKGMLTVTAVHKGTGKKQDIIVTDATNARCLPVDELRRMRAEKFAEWLEKGDEEKFAKEEKEAIERKNQVYSLALVDKALIPAKPLRGLLV